MPTVQCTVKPRTVAILGSTGSIGTQTLDVIDRLGPDRVRVVGLAAYRSETQLEAQAARHPNAKAVLVARDGGDAMVGLAADPDVDTVVVAVAGAAALKATLAAARAGKRICIATKEVLVAAGEIVIHEAACHGAELLPVDSEHSAVFQCMLGYPRHQVRRLHLTASGGPFRTWEAERIGNATLDEALNHPTWKMGGKITVDSASLMNKGLEVIEACRLFGFDESDVPVVVHPQSIVHSFVETTDGSLLAQLGLPDMRLPIQIAMLHPEKVDIGTPRLNPTAMGRLHFEAPDENRFPALGLARQAWRDGGTAPAVMNAANEAAVGRFLEGGMRFGAIHRMVLSAMESVPNRPADTLDTILEADRAARHHVMNLDLGI